MPESGGDASGRLRDPLLMGVLALVVGILHGFDGYVGHDQAAFVYGGERLAHGVPPYAGIFNSIGPMTDVVTGVGVRIGWGLGLDAVLASRLTYLVVSALAVALLSVLAREALRSRAAGLVAPAVLLTFEDFLVLSSDGPRDKTLMLLFLEGALLLLLRRRWLWAGAVVALAILTWQPVVLPAVAATVVAVLTTPTGRARAVLQYVVGGAVPTALATLLFAVSGHLRVAWWGFVLVNVGYTSQTSIVASWSRLTHGYGASLVVVILGWVALLALGARHRKDRALALLAVSGLVAGAWTCVAVNGAPDLFVVLPFSALGVAVLVDRLCQRLTAATALRAATAVAVVALVASSVEAVSTRDHRLADERSSIDRALAALPPGATVLSIDSPEVPALLERRNPYPWQLFNSAMTPFLDDHLPGGLAALAGRISRLHPDLIAVGDAATDAWLLPLLHRDYRKVGEGESWTWWAPR